MTQPASGRPFSLRPSAHQRLPLPSQPLQCAFSELDDCTCSFIGSPLNVRSAQSMVFWPFLRSPLAASLPALPPPQVGDSRSTYDVGYTAVSHPPRKPFSLPLPTRDGRPVLGVQDVRWVSLACGPRVGPDLAEPTQPLRTCLAQDPG